MLKEIFGTGREVAWWWWWWWWGYHNV